MKNLQKLLVVPALLAGLCGCATDNTPKPTPLSKVAPASIQVRTLWSRSMSGGNDGQNLTLGSALAGNILVSAGIDGEVTAFNLQTHLVLWRTEIPQAISATPAINSTSVFVATKNAYLYALDLTTGKVNWNAPLPRDRKSVV